MAAKKPVIAVDIDDVLANSTDSLRRVVNKHLGVDLQPEHYQIPGEGYHGYYAKVWAEHGLEVTLEELEPPMVQDQSHVQPHDAAQTTLTHLKERYSLVVVTARNPEWKQATLRWLDMHFPGVFDQVVFSAEVTEGENPKTKGQVCRELGVSWLIDDNVDHARSALDEGVQVVLFGTYGWHHNVPEHAVRCKDWRAVREYFDAV